MANDINQTILCGHLTRDVELKVTPGGTSVASFSIACNRSYMANGEKKEEVSYFNVVAWSKLGELVAEYCKKGKQVIVSGRLQQRRWQDKNGQALSTVELVSENIQFLGDKQKWDDEPHENKRPANTGASAGANDSQDDMPW